MFELNDKLVLGVASSALFDLTESDEYFREHGEKAYREYSREHENDPFSEGVAFPLVRRLLSFNDLAVDPANPLVEVLVLSSNDPFTGLRVMTSCKHHGLPITRGIFMQGRSPYHFSQELNISLFLSANQEDVIKATNLGLAAGKVIGQSSKDTDDQDLRIAFDFDGVIADDSSERVYKESGMEGYRNHETANALDALPAGPLLPFLRNLNKIQEIEQKKIQSDPDYRRRLYVSLVTARNAPAHERAIKSLDHWEVSVNDAFFLGGVDKYRVLKILSPHVFFDDDTRNFETALPEVPSVHIPYGIKNSSSV